MNISVSFFAFNSVFSLSPLTVSRSSRPFTFSVADAHCSKWFRSFLRMDASSAQVSIRNSHFANFLDRVARFSSVHTIKKRQLHTFHPVSVANTIFRNISNEANTGGAMLSFARMTLVNCFFDSCYGKSGGGLSCHSDSNCTYVSFKGCHSLFNSGSFYCQSKVTQNTCFTQSLFANSNSKFFGAFYKETKGPLVISSSNLTGVTASGCVGAFEASGGSFDARYMNIDKSKAVVHNGGCVIRDSSLFSIQNSIFKQCEHSSSLTQAAAVLLLYRAPSGALIQDSYFMGNIPSSSFTLSVVDGDSLTIDSCIFSGEKKNELYLGNGKIIVENCSFLSRPRLRGREITIGFMSHLNFKLEEVITPKGNWHHYYYSVFCSAFVALAFAFLMTYLHTTAFRKLCSAKKAHTIL